MFTGIIAALGSIKAKQAKAKGDLQLQLHCPQLDMSDVQLGDSIAVNGVCLTVTQFDAQGFLADLSNETLSYSLFSQMPVGAKVNLEKALRLGDRLGGHMVSGHVDGLGVIRRMQQDASSWRIWVEAPAELQRFIAVKGSITMDGISLTVNAKEGLEFQVNVVPHTAANTLVQEYRIGRQLHLEVDLIARYLDQLQQPNKPQTPGMSASWLAQHGFG